MTPLLLDQLGALRACLQRLHALGCTVEFFGAEITEKPVVRLAAPTTALLDHLDAQQIPIGRAFSLVLAELDGCAVAWRASANVRVEEGEHIEVRI